MSCGKLVGNIESGIERHRRRVDWIDRQVVVTRYSKMAASEGEREGGREREEAEGTLVLSKKRSRGSWPVSWLWCSDSSSRLLSDERPEGRLGGVGVGVTVRVRVGAGQRGQRGLKVGAGGREEKGEWPRER